MPSVRSEQVAMSNYRIGGLRIAWIEAFIEVAANGSFSEAGRAMGCSQSTVSRYVDSLERWLEKVLTNRDTPVELTGHGHEFLATSIEVMNLLNASRANIGATHLIDMKTSGKDIDMSQYNQQL